MNSYQRASVFVFRFAGFFLAAYAVIGAANIAYRVISGTKVPPISAHIFAATEYLLLGVLFLALATPLGIWLGRGLD